MVKQSRRPSDDDRESGVAEALTVGWMLAVMTTLACSVVSALVWLAARGGPAENGLLTFASYLHFCAVVASLVSFAQWAAVLKLRRQSPPRSITLAAIVIGLAPLVAALF